MEFSRLLPILETMERNTYRIIDVNFNRAREAARMIEEFCRFSLNSKPLSSRAKSVRHQLSSAIAKLDTSSLLACRDSQTDVGRGLVIDNQLKRGGITDCFTAACKRLTEALRVLAETTQIIDPAVAAVIENLRFEAYTLEKDASLTAETRRKYKDVRLYVLVTVNPGDSVEKVSKLVSECIKGGADCIQIRAKGLEDSETVAISKTAVDICSDAGVLSIINDRVDIAVISGADGVHLGLGDISVHQARSLQLSPLVIGASTHSPAQLKAAIKAGADYVGIGPAFTTATKPHEKTAGLGYISKAVEMLENTGISHAAIGGISLENIDSVLKAGAKTAAICSAITHSESPADMCGSIRKRMEAYPKPSSR